MKIKVLFFASARESTGVTQAEIELAESATTEDLKKVIQETYPRLSFEKNTNLKLAINRRYVTEITVLRDRDEVAVIPPIAGG